MVDSTTKKTYQEIVKQPLSDYKRLNQTQIFIKPPDKYFFSALLCTYYE